MRFLLTRSIRNSLCTLGALIAFNAVAQPVPKLNAMSPEYVTRGTTNDFTFTGENLGNVTGFLFFGEPGLGATNLTAASPPPAPKPSVNIEASGITRAEPPPPPRDDKKLVVKLAIAADAPLGTRELRVVTPNGVSNPIQVKVSQFPEVAESGGNHSLETAQVIALPVTISGAVAGALSDYFKFKATKGQDIIIDVDANRRGSPLDSSLSVLNAAGKELARSEDAKGLDSLIFFNAPADGDYVIQLRDFRYQGGGDFKYRMTVGAVPYVDAIFPFGGQRGKQVEVALKGRNLDGVDKMVFNIAPTAPLGRQEIRATTPRGLSNPFAFEASELPDFAESEPNDAIDQGDKVSVPVAINGRIGKPEDIDRFKFKSDKDQKLICEVTAFRFGSALDPLLILTDDRGNILQQNDDANGPDAKIEFDAKKDTEYVLGIRDLTQRGGESFGYRLTIRPPSAGEAGFTAKFFPDVIRVSRDGHTKVRCEVDRFGGFDGPVRFAFADLPAGVLAEPLMLPNGPASGILLLSVSKDAPTGNFPVKLTATGIVGGKPVTRTATPLIGDAGVRQAFVTVLDTAPFTVEPDVLSLAIEQDQVLSVDVQVQRREGFAGDVKLIAEGFAAGREAFTKNFDYKEAVVKAGESVGKLSFKAKLDSEVGTRTAIIRGESTDGGNVIQYSRPFPVTITQVPLVISSTLSRLSVTALPASSESAAREAFFTVKADRRMGFDKEIALTYDGIPDGITVSGDKIPAGAGELLVKITANEKAAAGKDVSFTVLGKGEFNDRKYKSRTGAIKLTISAPAVEVASTNAPPKEAASPAK